MIGLGAGATAAAAAIGAVLAVLYGRRGSASVSATVYSTPSGFVVAARPCVKAVGLFRVKFRDGEGVTIGLTELYVENGDLKEGRIWTNHGAFGQQYVDAGEDLLTTVVFPPMQVAPSVIGWQVFLRVAATTRLAKFRTGWWADQVFVARPNGKEVG